MIENPSGYAAWHRSYLKHLAQQVGWVVLSQEELATLLGATWTEAQSAVFSSCWDEHTGERWIAAQLAHLTEQQQRGAE